MGIFYGIISAICYGLIPLFTLPLLAAGIPVETALVYRFGISTIAIGAILALKRESFAIGWVPFWKISGLSLFYAGAVMLYFYALELLPSGVVATLQFLFPVMVMAIMVMFFHEPFRWQTALAIALAFIGVALLSLGEQGAASPADMADMTAGLFSSPVFWGIVMSLLAGLLNGLYFIAIQVARLPKINGLTMTFYVMLAGTACFALNGAVNGELMCIMGAREIGIALMLALITAVISNLTLILAIREIGSTMSSVLAVGEPLTAVTAGVFVFGEPFTAHLALGIVLIVSSVFLALLGPRGNGPADGSRTKGGGELP